MEMSEIGEDKIKELETIEQSLSNLMFKRQQLSTQLAEIESAIQELSGSGISYKIVGNIMVKVSPDSLSKELNEKKSVTELKIKTIENQEQKLKEKLHALQNEVLGQISQKNDGEGD